MAGINITLANGQEAGKTLEEITKQVNRAATELKKAEINSDDFFKKQQKFQELKGVQENLKQQINGTNAASAELSKTWGGILNQIPGFSQISGAMGKAKTGVGGLTTGFHTLKGAIISTGIGVLVILLGSLFAWFQKTERGADFLSKAMAAAGAAVNVLIDRASKLIDALIAFVNGNWTEAAEKFGEATSGIADEIIRETQAAWRLAEALDALEERQNDFILTLAKARIELSQLQKIYDDETLSIEERTKAIERAREVNRTVNGEKMAQLREELRITLQLEELTDDMLASFIERGIKLEEVGFSESLEEDRKKAIEILANYVGAQAENTDKEIELMKKFNKISKKERADDSKDLREKLREKEQLLKDQAAAAIRIEDMRVQLMDDGFEKELAKIELKTRREIEALKGSAEQKLEAEKLIEEIKLRDIEALNEKFSEEAAKKANERRAKEREQKLQNLELDLAIEQNLLNEQLLAEQLTREQWQQLTAQNAIAFQKSKLDVLRQAHGEESEEYQRAYAEYLALQQAQADQSVAIKQKEMDDQMAAMQGALGTFGNFFGAIANLQQQGSNQWKAFATASAIMSTIQGAINAYTSTAAIPIVGPGLAPLAAGVALAAGYANVRQIQKQKVEPPAKPKAEFGGFLRGPRHSQGGIDINAEGGEFIFSRKAVQAIGADTLTRVNDRYTRRFEAGGPVSPFPDRGPISSGMAKEMAEIRGMIKDLVAAQDRRIDRIKVENVVTETRDKINVVNSLQEEADV